jgi:hypothetical protein
MNVVAIDLSGFPLSPVLSLRAIFNHMSAAYPTQLSPTIIGETYAV